MVSVFLGIAPRTWPKSRGPPPQTVCVLWLWNRITQKNNPTKTSIFVGLPVEVSLLACPWTYFCCGLIVEVYSLACPWKYICCGLPVEVSLLACAWKYLRWPARGSIVGGLPLEVSMLAYPRKYLCWLARGSFFAGLPVGVSLLWPAPGSIVAVACP